MTAIIFGFVTFAQSVADTIFPLHIQVFISISVILGIVSILICVIVLYLQKYQFPVEQTYYFRNDAGNLLKDPNGQLRLNDNRKLELVSEQSLFEGYLGIIQSNRTKNDQKATLLIWGFVVHLISIAFIGVAIFFFFQLGSPDDKKDEGRLTCTEVDTGNKRVINDNQLLELQNNPNAKLMICLS